jgi:hypothetical protein
MYRCLENGSYIITRVQSITEFYGYAHVREAELKKMQMELENSFNRGPDQSLGIQLPIEGTICAIQNLDQYSRVMIK